jgi:hypothetical protein
MTPTQESQVAVIGFAEALSAPEVAWSLLDAGFVVKAFARKGRRASVRHSRHVSVCDITAPEVDAGRSRTELESFLRSVSSGDPRSRIVFPLDDASLLLLGEASLPPGSKLVGPAGAAVDLALDKWHQVHSARAAGFNVPESFLASSRKDFAHCPLALPLMLRPSRAATVTGGRLKKGKNWICADRRELGEAVSSWDEAVPLLVQPYIEGSGEGVFGLATDRGIEAWSAHRRLRMMNPHGSGSSACAAQEVPESAKTAAEQLVRAASWKGLFMVELLRDGSGGLWFVEFNGRPWGSMALARRLGLEYPAWAAAVALNPRTPPVAGSGLRPQGDCRNLGREVMHLMFVLRGPKSKALTKWPGFWRSLREMLKISRRTSLYNWRRGDLGVFFSDFWNTIRDNLFKSKATTG